VPRSIICSLPATRNRCAGTPHIGSSRHVAKSYPPSDDDGTMNSAVDFTIYWGLRAFPFDNVPDPRFYVPCSQYDTADKWLSYGIQTRKGMLLLTGDIGCGKTLLSRRLIVGLPPTQYDVALVAIPRCVPPNWWMRCCLSSDSTSCDQKPGDCGRSMSGCIEYAASDQLGAGRG
jgi:hypothetical protein